VGDGSIDEAMAATRRAKPTFTEADVYERARQTLLECVLHGTTRVRTHVEVDPLVELRGLDGVIAAAESLRAAVDVDICVFVQDGLFNNPGTDELLVAALARGVKAVGGTPYADTEPIRHIHRIFELAAEFDVDVDFHLDLSQLPEPRFAEVVCEETAAWGWEGRVTVGHLTQWSMLPPATFAVLGDRMVDLGIGVVVLPATDLFLMGRTSTFAKPRGVLELADFVAAGGKAAIATNNVLNPFTPYGDCSLVRMANLYANICHLATPEELSACFDLVTRNAADVIGISNYGIAVGNHADLVALDGASTAEVVARVAAVRWVVKNGRQSVRGAGAELLGPHDMNGAGSDASSL